jgi:glutathione S-transferase
MIKTMFELFVSSQDYCVLKVRLLASLVGAKLQVEQKSQAELEGLDASAKGMLLKTPSGYLSQHIAILRYISEISCPVLMGTEELDRAQIDQWLEYSWHEVGKSSCAL